MSQVIVCWDSSFGDRDTIDGAPVWHWSSRNTKDQDKPSIVDDIKSGDFVIHCEFWTKDGESQRKKPWAVHKAWGKSRAHVNIGFGQGIAYFKTPEEAVQAARFLIAEHAKREQEKLEAAEKLKAAEQAAVASAAQTVGIVGIEAAAVYALKDACGLLLAYEGLLRDLRGDLAVKAAEQIETVRRSRLAKLEIVRLYEADSKVPA